MVVPMMTIVGTGSFASIWDNVCGYGIIWMGIESSGWGWDYLDGDRIIWMGIGSSGWDHLDKDGII